MALLEDALSGNLVTASGLVLGAVLLKRFAPDLTPGLRASLISGLKLVAEAEFEVDDGVIGKLAEQTVNQLLQTMPAHGHGEPNDAARQIVGRFAHEARRRSARRAWHSQDRAARYRHHVRKLQAAVEHAAHDLPPAEQAYLHQACTIAEDW